MRLSKHLFRVGSLAIAAGLTTFAHAQDEPKPEKPTAEKPVRPERGPGQRGGGDPIMRALDVDQNHELSAAELDGAPKVLLSLDKNKDGAISREELRPERPEDAGPMARLDKNKDGKLSKDELPEPMQARFAELDKNKDGFLTEDELQGAVRGGRRGGKPRADGEAKPEGEPLPEREPEAGKRPHRAQDRRGDPRGGGSALARAVDMNKDGTLDAEEIKSATASLKALDKNKDGKLTRDEIGGGRGAAGYLGRFDTDGDGKLSKDEAPGRMADRFDEIDTDADGFIDAAEMEAMMKNFRRGGGRGRGGQGDGDGERPGKKTDDGDE